MHKTTISDKKWFVLILELEVNLRKAFVFTKDQVRPKLLKRALLKFRLQTDYNKNVGRRILR